MPSNKMVVLHVELTEDESVITQYVSYHTNVWPEVTSDLKDRPIGRMRIYSLKNQLAMLLEVSESFNLADGVTTNLLHQK